MVRGAFVALLSLEPDFDVVAEAWDGRSAVDEAIRRRPDVAVVDWDMPILDGFGVAAELTRLLPSCAVVIFTSYARPSLVRRALESGARAFVSKDERHHVLAEVIRQVNKGAKYVNPVLAADALIAPSCPLTVRELAVLRLAKDGASTTAIARQLSLAAGTVRNYLAATTAKLGVGTRAEAIRVAQDNDWF